MQFVSLLMVLIAAVLWGTTGTAQTFIVGDVSSVAVATMRSLIGGCGLLLLLLLSRNLNFKHWNWKWTILAALSIAAFQCLFFTSVRLTGVAVGTVVTIGSAPIFAGIIEAIFWRIRPMRIWVIATMVSICGSILLFSPDNETSIYPKGVILALCAGFLFALYTNVSKRLMETAETLQAVAVVFTLCAVFLVPFSFTNGVQWLTFSTNIIVVLYLAIFTCAIAYLLYLSGLKKISSSTAVTISLIEPLTAALFGVFLIGEYLSAVSWIGVALLLGGIVILTLGQYKQLG